MTTHGPEKAWRQAVLQSTNGTQVEGKGCSGNCCHQGTYQGALFAGLDIVQSLEEGKE